MLTELRISNFALIDEMKLVLGEGFHVLTGETGAGKSLLVDALLLLTGRRASPDLIRTDADEAVLEAAFSLPPSHPILARLGEQSLLNKGETEFVIRRVLSRSGRNRLYVNGALGTAQMVKDLTDLLLDIHSQHDQQSLFSSLEQLIALDEFARLRDLKAQFLQRYEAWKAGERRRSELEAEAVLTRQNEEFVRFQYGELTSAELRSGEAEALANEHRRLSHSARVSELVEEVYGIIYGGEHSLLDRLQRVQRQLQEMNQIDSSVKGWIDLSDSASIALRELAEGLRTYRKNLNHHPERLAQIDERLAKLQRLQKKYGGSVEELIEKMRSLERSLDRLATGHERLQELDKEIAAECREAQDWAERLSQERRRAARLFEKKIASELGMLGMKHTEFQIKVDSRTDLQEMNSTGKDRVEFLLSANPGEPLLPLSRVASGGELSRIMLGLKTVLAEADRIPVLVFDEVDTGVGGAIASTLGDRLQQLARYHQVFCITHLPQIASKAHAHYLIEKKVMNKKTVVEVRRLNETGRREEIARLLGGATLTPAVRRSAADMIAHGNPQKSSKPKN